MSSTLVSIGVPVLNGERYLPRALDSLLAQTRDALEVVVSDNASDDATPEIVMEYTRRDSRVRSERLDTRVPLLENWNRLIDLARGDYFRWNAHDDWIDERYLETLVTTLEANPTSVLAYSGTVLVAPNDRVVGGTNDLPKFLTSKHRLARFHGCQWQIRGFPGAEQGLARMDAVRQTRGMVNVVPKGRLWLAEMALLGGIEYVPEPLLFRHVEPTQYLRDAYLHQDPENVHNKLTTTAATVAEFARTLRSHGVSRIAVGGYLADTAAGWTRARLAGLLDRLTAPSEKVSPVETLLPRSDRYKFPGIEVSGSSRGGDDVV